MRRVWLLALLGSLLAFGAAFAQSAGVNYVYDSLGRLVAVYDPAGNAASTVTMRWATCFQLRITPATTFAGFDLSSTSGSVGSNITVYGTNFCSNPSVTINGTTATVLSSTSTQIVFTIPSGAATGAVQVTCGTNIAISGTLTVTTPNGTPTITSFSPGSGGPGTAVTVSGANFQTNPADDYVEFGLSDATVTSAAATSIATTVPSSASTGPIRIATDYGEAISAIDFFVPPPGAAGTMDATAQIAFGTPSTITLGSGYGLFAFNGISGQIVSIEISTAFDCGSMSLFAPNNQVVESTNFCGYDYYMGTATLPKDWHIYD
jgi:IPT/TIG domain